MTFFTTGCIVSIEDVQICDIVSIDNPEVNIKIEHLHRFQMKQSAFFSHTEIYFNSQPTKLFSHHGDCPDFLISNQVKYMQ